MTTLPLNAPASEATATTPAIVRNLIALLTGVLFGVGLLLGGMTRPENVLAFLDVTGAWNPLLAFVMGGAIPVFALAWRHARRTPRPLLTPEYCRPSATRIDRALILGAALFGVGWGLIGLCPAPAVVGLGAGAPTTVLFVIAMGAGMVLEQRLTSRKST